MVEAAKAIMEHCTCTANWVGEHIRGFSDYAHNSVSRFNAQPINNKLQE